MENIERKLAELRNPSAVRDVETTKDSLEEKKTDPFIPSVAHPSTEKDIIIIKSSIEEMMKGFFKDYVIVWHDPDANNQENQQYIEQLTKFCEVLIFTEWEKAKDFIDTTQAVCHVGTSGTNGELLVKEIFEKENVCNIYVFCENKEDHSGWAQNYQNISSVETDIQSLINQTHKNLLEWYKKASSLNFNLPAFAPIFNDSDTSQMNNLHRYLKVIPNFKNREQAKNDFLNLSKVIYTDPNNQKHIADFEANYNEYNKEKTLRWYTLESFLYKVTNNCLRIATSDSIQYCRLALKDIEQAIKDQYQEKSKDFNGLLYRGAYMSEEEWSSLKENQDKEIEMHGFLSVSKIKNIGLRFMEEDPSKKVFITIIVSKGPNQEEQGFAEMHQFSQYPQEKEILFNVRSRFTVLETEDEYEYSATSKCRHLVLLYGAQGFRKFTTEENLLTDVKISNVEMISCAHCHTQNEKLFFLSIADSQKDDYYCKTCIDHGVSPFLCIPTTMNEYSAKFYGTLLLNQNQIPFYGYKCSQCQATRQKRYFLCTDCTKKWCENCFEKETHPCLEAKHNVILETSPYTFWCEKMSVNESSHLRYQESSLQKGRDVFQQAEMYTQSHEHEKALEYYKLYIEENEPKSKDHNLATSYNNIGLIYQKQGKYKEALTYNLKSLEIEESLERNDNYQTMASTYNNIGTIYIYQGEYNKAVEFYLKSLDLLKSAYGDDNHYRIATLYHNIASVYVKQKEHNKALEYYLKSIDIGTSIYGSDNHPKIAGSYNNIGGLYDHQGDHDKALEYFLKCLEIQKSVLGDNHTDTATSYNNIGSVYRKQGEYNKALECFFKSLEIRKLAYGDDNHPGIATVYQNIGTVYKSQGEDKKALEYFLKALDIKKSIFGDNHINIANYYNQIANVYNDLEEYSKSLEYAMKSLDVKKLVFGENHTDVATAYFSIGIIYENKEEYSMALEYHLKALDIRKSVHGDEHSSTIQIQEKVNEIQSMIDQNKPQ